MSRSLQAGSGRRGARRRSGRLPRPCWPEPGAEVAEQVGEAVVELLLEASTSALGVEPWSATAVGALETQLPAVLAGLVPRDRLHELESHSGHTCRPRVSGRPSSSKRTTSIARPLGRTMRRLSGGWRFWSLGFSLSPGTLLYRP